MRYPLPYAFARTARLLLEDDGQALTLWHDGRPNPGHLSEVMRRHGAGPAPRLRRRGWRRAGTG